MPVFLTENMKRLNEFFINCTDCNVYSVTKLPPVPGYGYGTNKIMFIGQSPGPHGADVTGIPFTRDKSGRQFQNLLKQLNLKFEDCYTTNLVKFCPGWNDLEDDWVTHSKSHLSDELHELKPRLIVTFGKHAFKYFAGADTSIRRNHGKVAAFYSFKEHDAIVFPFYHFAYYIRNNMWTEFNQDVFKFKKVLKTVQTKIEEAKTIQVKLDA